MRVSFCPITPISLSARKALAPDKALKNLRQTPGISPAFDKNPKEIDFKGYSMVHFGSKHRVQRKDFFFANPNLGIRCPSCGDKMKNFNKAKARKLAAEIAPKRGKELQAILYEHRGDFQATKRELADEIISIIPKYPDKNLSELLEVLGKKKYIDILRTKQLLVTTFLGNEILNLTPENMSDMVEWQKGQVVRIMQAKEEGQFRNKYLITSFIKYAEEHGIKIDEESVRAYFGRLPNSKKDVEAFVVKYMRRSPREAAYRLIKNSEPTIEHIVPFSKSGDNSMGNLLVMCSDCNTARGDMSYKDYIEQHPEMRENILKYFDDIKKVLKRTRKTSEYQGYIDSVKETLQNYSPESFNFFTNSGIL